jgi:hypothetical protein
MARITSLFFRFKVPELGVFKAYILVFSFEKSFIASRFVENASPVNGSPAR